MGLWCARTREWKKQPYHPKSYLSLGRTICLLVKTSQGPHAQGNPIENGVYMVQGSELCKDAHKMLQGGYRMQAIHSLEEIVSCYSRGPLME